MYTVQCTLYSVQCTVYSVQCTVYSVQCTVYRVQCTMYTVHCTVYSIQYTVYNVQFTVYNVQITLHCTLVSTFYINNKYNIGFLTLLSTCLYCLPASITRSLHSRSSSHFFLFNALLPHHVTRRLVIVNNINKTMDFVP